MQNLETRKELARMIKYLRAAGYGNDCLTRPDTLSACVDSAGNTVCHNICADYAHNQLSWRTYTDLVKSCVKLGYDDSKLYIRYDTQEDDYGSVEVYVLVEMLSKSDDKHYYATVLPIYLEEKQSKQQDTTAEELTNLLGYKILPYHINKIREIVRNRE